MKRWRMLRRLWSPFTESLASVYASSACFYLLLSFLPASMLLLSVLPWFPISEELWNWLFDLLPETFRPLLSNMLQLLWKKRSVLTLSISTFLTFWSASKGMLAISDGLNSLMTEEPRRSFLRRHWNGMVNFLMMLLALLPITLGVMFRSFLVHWIPRFQMLYSCLLLILIFSLLFRILPRKRIPYRFCFWGGCFSGIGWVLFTWIFSIYVRWFSNKTQLYGPLGVLLLAAIWLQVSILLLLYGGLLTSVVAEDKYHPFQIAKHVFRNGS